MDRNILHENSVYRMFIFGCWLLFMCSYVQAHLNVYLNPQEVMRSLDNEPKDNLSHHINVRPDIGLLASTARTFIQDGITTKYETEVVGTTLDKGKLYAHYLKKSSRVLYDDNSQNLHQTIVLPSVVTSWVGLNTELRTRSFLKSHNDLFNADEPNWRDIDDRLLLDAGNSDFIDLDDIRKKKQLMTAKDKLADIKLGARNNITNKSSETDAPLIAMSQHGQLEESLPKIAANKILHIADLPTYTVLNSFSPSSFPTEIINKDEKKFVKQSRIGENGKFSNLYKNINHSKVYLNRSPKLNNIMLLNMQDEDIGDRSNLNSAPVIPINAALHGQLSTTTYYGFADFTTVVGDSVIVFSPSTSALNINLGHVTSAKGEATLNNNLEGILINTYPTSTVDLKENTKILAPAQATKFTTLNANSKYINIIDSDLAPTSIPTAESNVVDKHDNGNMNNKNVLSSNGSISKSATDTPATYSRPSDQEVLEIYASLSRAEIARKSTMLAQVDVNTLVDIESSFAKSITSPTIPGSLQSSEVNIKPNADVKPIGTIATRHVLGGATTIFFEDDPFINFVMQTTTLDSVSPVLTTKVVVDMNVITNKLQPEDEATTESQTTVIEYEDLDEGEGTTTEPITISDNAGKSENNPVSYNKVQIKGDNSNENKQIKPSSDPDDATDVIKDCLRTSRVFLTQIPKAITQINTIFKSDGSDDGATNVETVSIPTFDIIETTKHYCLKPKPTTILKSTNNDASSIPEIMMNVPQLEKPAIQRVDGEELITDTSDSTTSALVTEEDDENVSDLFIETTTTQIQNDTEYAEVISQDENSDIIYSTEPDDVIYSTEDDSDEDIEFVYKTLFTTYTYLTTFFIENATSLSSHTEVFTNIITSTLQAINQDIKPTMITAQNETLNITTKELIDDTFSSKIKYTLPTELESIFRISEYNKENPIEQKADNATTLDDNKVVKTYLTTYTYYTTVFVDDETEIMSRTETYKNYVTDVVEPTAVLDKEANSKEKTFDEGLTDYSNDRISNKTNDIEESYNSNSTTITLVTDVRSSISNGDRQIINQDPKLFDDQVSSESNTDEIRPSASLLLQTRFTTFTYYTTMYSNDLTNVVYSLDTVTNVVTETLQPTQVESIEEATLPITYFTTFTYWTKLAKNGEITTLSREETVSNIVTPTSLLNENELAVPKLNQEEMLSTVIATGKLDKLTNTPVDSLANAIINDFSKDFDVPNITKTLNLTTYYTTYTYYTTSYDLDKTMINSRYEIITNIITPTVSQYASSVNNPNTDYSGFTTPVANIITPALSNEENVIIYDYRKIIDAEGISTLYYTTKILPTTVADGTPSEFTKVSSSLYVDEAKKSLQSDSIAEKANGDEAVRPYKTGLVRLIEGTRIGNNTTTSYQSKVIGTFIDNRYAQIIESTSSFIFSTNHLSTYNIGAISEPFAEPTRTEIFSAIKPTQLEGSNSIKTSENPSKSGEDDNVEKDNNEQNKSILSSTKGIFTPVIRPFASRNRLQFAPKKRSSVPSSATTITRLDFTPTITATPALKTIGRLSSSRKSAYPNNIGGTFSSSRRLFGRPSKVASTVGNNVEASSAYGGVGRTRGSLSSRPTLSSSRRAGVIIRPSSANGFRNRNKSTGFAISSQQSAATEELTTLASDTRGDIESSTSDLPVNESENEDSSNVVNRQNQNNLLRFRRPINRPAGFTPANQRAVTANSPKLGSGVSQRRNPLLGRSKPVTTTSTTTTTPQPRVRSFVRPQIGSVPSRTRPQNSLFPPRGLLQKQNYQQTKIDDTEIEGNLENEDDSEYDDEEEEDSEDDADDAKKRRRRHFLAKTNPFESLIEMSEKKSLISPRVRREADTSFPTRTNFRNRFRHPKFTTVAEEHTSIENTEQETSTQPTPTGRQRNNGRFGTRYTGNNHAQTTSTTKSSTLTKNHRAIRPTRPTNGRAQFTLREKDTTTIQKTFVRPNTKSFRRIQSSSSPRRPSTSTTSSNRRLNSYKTNNLLQETTARYTSPRTRNNLSRTRTTVRGRNRNDHKAEQVTLPDARTITVTHVKPAEATIPVVNGKVTEYKNVVTAKTSIELLGPQQYTSFVGSNGQTMLALLREDTSVNYGGATEITQYVLHETPTTTVIFTPTTIRGRKTSFSHILPSTVYSVENVVSTSQPQISANAPLANILLSQLLLGNLGLHPANPLLGAPISNQLAANGLGAPVPPTPVTEYRTHASTYVTTLYEGMSTVLPVTFQGKKILTTVYDTSAQTITATEYLTDTIVTTPTPVALPPQSPQINSLLLQQLLLQQELQSQNQQLPIIPSAPSLLSFTDKIMEVDSNNIRLSNENDNDIPIIEDSQPSKTSRKKTRKSGKTHKRKHQTVPDEEPENSSVVTLYVSGKRPGEFSTVLSTVSLGPDSTIHKRQVTENTQTVSIDNINEFYVTDGSELVMENVLPNWTNSGDDNGLTIPEIDFLEKGEYANLIDKTQALENIVGDVTSWHTRSAKIEAVDRPLVMPNTLQAEILENKGSRVKSNQIKSNRLIFGKSS